MDETVASRSTAPSAHPDMSGGKARKPGLELLIGSNLFRDTNGVVKIDGKEQLVFEFKPDQGLLLLTMDLYSEGGTHIAHLRRNMLVLNQAGQFSAESHRAQQDVPDDFPWVRLLDHRTGRVALEARGASEHRVHITTGQFHSHRGTPVEITPNFCRLGSGTTLFGDIVESRGGMVLLGSMPAQSFPARL
jgi:hypothetical protein